MKMFKRITASVLTAAMIAILVTGCGEATDDGKNENITLDAPVGVTADYAIATERDMYEYDVYSSSVNPLITEYSFAKDQRFKKYGAFNDVDEIGFKLVLKRGALFDDDTSDTKSGNATIAYFLGTAVILVLIFFGLTLAGNIYYDNNAYLILGSSKKGFSIAYYAAKLLSLTTIYYLATSILLVVALKNEYIGSLIGKIDSAKLFLNPLLIALYISAFLSMLMFMMPRSMDGILLIFITSIVLTIASGLLIPVAFMPLIFTRLHGALPFTSLHSYIVSIIGLGDSYIPGIIYTLIFMIIGYLVLKIKIKNAS